MPVSATFPISLILILILSHPFFTSSHVIPPQSQLISQPIEQENSPPSTPSSSTTTAILPRGYSHPHPHFKHSSSYRRSLWPPPLPKVQGPLSSAPLSPPTTVCTHTSHLLMGGEWWGMGILALFIILLTGLLAGLTLGVMSMDTVRLKVWTRTGSEERRAKARTILSIRRHPNWLLTSLILASVALNEGLPLVLSHLFPIGAWKPFVFSTILVALIGELLPQAIMPMFIFQIVDKSSWFVYAVMWLTAPLSVPIAWGFRWCRSKSKGSGKLDGLLEVEDLGEFLRAHEFKQGWGGELDEGVGEVMRRVLAAKDLLVGGAAATNWSAIPKVDERMFINAPLAGMLARSDFAFAIVMRLPNETPMSGFMDSGTMSGTVSGILLKKELISVNLALTRVRDLNVLSIPVVHETCNLFSLAKWFMESPAHIALIVPSTDELDTRNSIAWTIGGRGTNGPRGPSIAHELSPLGVLSAGDFFERIFSCVYESKLLRHSESPALLVPQRSFWKGFRKRTRHGKSISRSITHDGTIELAHTTGSRITSNTRALLQRPRATSTSVLSHPTIPWTIPCGARGHQIRKQAPWKPEELLNQAIRRHETLTEPADDAGVVAIIARAAEDLMNQAIRRHETLTDPAEDELVTEMIRKAATGLTI